MSDKITKAIGGTGWSADMTTNRAYCPVCEASLTETDYECGKCTQCGAVIVKGWDDDNE